MMDREPTRTGSVSYFRYGQRGSGRRYLRVAVPCAVDAIFRIVRSGGDRVLPTLNMPLGSSTTADAYPLADLAPDLGAWSETPDALDRLLRRSEVRRACQWLMNQDSFQFVELWQGRLSVVYLEPGRCSVERQQALIEGLAVIAEAGEQTWPLVRRNWAFERFWHGGGGLVVTVLAALLLIGIALAVL